jgi:hypothetical protein
MGKEMCMKRKRKWPIFLHIFLCATAQKYLVLMGFAQK